MDENRSPTLMVDKGLCYAFFAYDVGRGIDLAQAERRITASKERSRIRHKHRTPPYFDYTPAPLRVTEDMESIPLGTFRTSTVVELLIYDFGGVSVSYVIPLQSDIGSLLTLSLDLYENEWLLADSKRRIEDLLNELADAVERPHLADSIEDYVIFQIESAGPSFHRDDLLSTHASTIAQMLRAESEPLADQEVCEATAHSLSFGQDDLAIIDWNAAVLVGQEMDDVRDVLEFANVELLEMRFVDQELDKALDEAYDTLSKRPKSLLSWSGLSFRADVHRIGQLQVDSAILFERVTNTLKLLGDQYLARIHRLASARFHLESWDTSITRKLQTLESIYGKMTDSAATRRAEVLEWIIIALLVVSIIMSFLPGASGH
jgi:hypothetical protein